MWLIGTIVTIVTFLEILILFRNKLINFFSKKVLYSDLSIIRKEMNRYGTASIRLAYNGKEHPIIDNIKIRATLTIPGKLNQIKLWILLEIAFLTGNYKSIEAIYGPYRHRIRPRLLHIYLIFFGIIMGLLMIMFFLNPVLLILMLLIGPPVEYKVVLIAEDAKIDIKDLDDPQRDFRRAFLIKPNDVINLLIKYNAVPIKQFFSSTTFFRYEPLITSIDCDKKDLKLKWKLPEPGKVVWEVHENILVNIKGRLFGYSISNAKNNNSFVNLSITE